MSSRSPLSKHLLSPSRVLAGALLLVLVMTVPSIDNTLRLADLDTDFAELHRTNMLLNHVRISSRNLLGAIINGDGVSDSTARAQVLRNGVELTMVLDSIELRYQLRRGSQFGTLEEIRIMKQECDSTNRILKDLADDVTAYGILPRAFAEHTTAFRTFTRLRQSLLEHFDLIVENQEKAIAQTEADIHAHSLIGLGIFAGFILVMGSIAVFVYRNAISILRQVQNSEAEQAAILSSVGETLWSIDTERRIQFFSPKLQAESIRNGLTLPEIGMDAQFLVPEGARPWWNAIYQRILSGESVSVERTSTAVLTSNITYDITGTPVFEAGRVIGALLLVRDVSQRKTYERQLIREREIAEEITQLKSAFLANMSHELRTPMIGVLGYADLIAEESADPDVREYAGRITASARRLLATLSSILEMSRIQSGTTGMHLTEFDVRDLIVNAMSTVQGAAASKHLELRLEATPGAAKVVLDSNYVSMILNRLIDNAVKFTDHGSVEIAVHAEADSNNVIISIRDTGIGIDQKFLEVLFKDFDQESIGLGRYYEGSGLGLAIAKKCADALGGQISVKSERGLGSEFLIELPRSLPQGPRQLSERSDVPLGMDASPS